MPSRNISRLSLLAIDSYKAAFFSLALCPIRADQRSVDKRNTYADKNVIIKLKEQSHWVRKFSPLVLHPSPKSATLLECIRQRSYKANKTIATGNGRTSWQSIVIKIWSTALKVQLWYADFLTTWLCRIPSSDTPTFKIKTMNTVHNQTIIPITSFHRKVSYRKWQRYDANHFQ